VNRLLDTPAAALDAYRAAGGYRALDELRAGSRTPAGVLTDVASAGLRGRGGAWFPVARKWEAALANPGPRVVVANGAEDEPGSLKDRHLMARCPHLVLDGALLSAVALAADTVRLYVNEHAPAAREAMQSALDECIAAGLTHGLDVALVRAPATYVAGEDSAATEFLQSGTAQPRTKPPYPAAAGLDGRPTVVSNVETLAHLALIGRDGPALYRSFGTESCTGTMLLTLPEECVAPGVYEVVLGSFLDEAIAKLGKGFVDGPARGVQVGGPASGWLTDLHVALDPESVAAAGSTLGCGAVRVLAKGHCAVDAVVSTSEFFSREQCGKCPPCRMATQFLHRASLAVLDNKGQVAQLDTAPTLIDQIRPATACSLPTFPLAPLTTARAVFADDFATHLAGGECALIHRRRSLRIEGT
jgi:NADH-quinone oxidoreductase subunit F